MTISIPSFDQARVMVVGDVMLDRYWYGSTSRISPEAPVPVVHVEDVEERPGGAGNVAMNIAALGANPFLLGVTGDDEAADSLEHLLRAQRVSYRFSRARGLPTVTKMRVMSRHQQLIRLDFEDGFQGAGFTELLSAFEEALSGTGAVVLSDYGKGALLEEQAFIERTRAAGKPVIVDPKGNDFKRYRGATVVTPNLAEFEAVVGACHDLDDLATRGEALRRGLELGALLITRSEQGMTLLEEGHAPLHMPARARDVYDVTGAGDTVVGVLAAVLAAGGDLVQAMTLANLAAGVVVGKLGAAAVTPAELETALHEKSPRASGVVSEEALLAAVQSARDRGETIVMTNGCFDILHVGHVSYLAKAKALGDRLIVAVNDDASVQRLKGHGRPINTLERRMAVLKALESVDWVVPFSEDTPERLICAVSPAVLVKGGDYRPEDVAGSECVRAKGGRVEIMDFEEGYSTTETIEAITRTAQRSEEGKVP